MSAILESRPLGRRIIKSFIIGCVILPGVVVCAAAFSDQDSEGQNQNYVGTWLRQGVYVNGQLQNQTPATLVYKKDTFTASGLCQTAGTIAVSGNTIKTVMTQSNCPGGVKAPFTVVYKYTISDDGKRLTLVSGPVKEIYLRK